MSANKTGGVETTTLSKVPESEKKSCANCNNKLNIES